jgi:hypothetical protein
VAYQVLAAGLRDIAHDAWPKVRHRAEEFGYPLENASPWFFEYPAPADVMNIFGARLNGVDASDADQATAAIFEARRRQRVLLDMIRAELGADPKAIALAHALGVRETWHASCRHRLTSSDLLGGHSFSDAIARGTYPVDVHSPQGTLLRHLDGKEQFVQRDGSVVTRRWREESATAPAFYEIPYRCLVPETAENLLVAGRLLDADREAFGGARVMVNMNQTGEAVGVAAWLSLKNDQAVASIPPETLRRHLTEGGSLLAPAAHQATG